jgi:hypothetical protein
MIDLEQFKDMPYYEYFLAGEEIFRRGDLQALRRSPALGQVPQP